MTVARELTRYKLDLVGVHVRWDIVSTVRAGDFFSYGKRNKNHKLGTDSFVHHRLVSAVKRVKFVSDGVSYTVLRGCWCNTIILNVHEANEKSDKSK